VLKKEWSERLKTALNKRKSIWSAGAAINEKAFLESYPVMHQLGMKIASSAKFKVD
jgi:hypothetical protein